ncbi:sulfite exporter TauE/SafE family protein [Bacteroidota bacterium]
MFIEVAGNDIYWFIPPLVTFVISFFTASGGVSGAFLLLPFQMSVLGFTTPSVSATNQLYNVVAIPGGVLRYIKEGRMLWQLTLVVALGTLPGVFAGSILRIEFLPDPTNFKVFAGFILLYLGVRVLSDVLQKKKLFKKTQTETKFQNLIKRKREDANNCEEMPKIKVNKFSMTKINYVFYDDEYTVSNVKVFLISLIVGIAGGAYGIGGGAIMAPLFIAIFKLPVYTIAGAALMGTFLTSVVAVMFFQFLEPFYPGMSVAPDWILGILFGIGGLAGIYLGARFQKYMPAKLIKWILAVCILFVAVRYIAYIF